MKTIVLAVLITLCLGVHFDKKPIHKHIEDLHKSKWGQTLLSMMALHSLSKGPVDELVQAIEDLVNDLQEELDVLEFDFNQRTNEHNKLVLTLEQEVNQAVVDYQRAQDNLENLLYPRRDNLRNKITQIEEYQDANRKTLAEVNLKRENEKEEFEAQMEDFNSAIESTDQALELLFSLRNPSLGQVFTSNVRKVHVQLNLIEQRIRPHSKHAPLIKALIQLANEQNFSSQDIVGNIIDKLNEFRNSVVDAINDATALEAVNQEEFEARVEQLDHEFSEFGKQITKITVDLEATINKINEQTEYAAQREADRDRFQTQLNTENDSYAAETKIYQDLKNEYLREQAVAESAEKVVKSADFSDIKI